MNPELGGLVAAGGDGAGAADGLGVVVAVLALLGGFAVHVGVEQGPPAGAGGVGEVRVGRGGVVVHRVAWRLRC